MLLLTLLPLLMVAQPAVAEEHAAQWKVVATAKQDRYGAAAALLPDGRVLLVGGYSNAKKRFIQSAEIWDGHGQKTVFAGNMSVPRAGHTATTLTDGRVLVAGGERGGAEESGTLDSAEIWDPATSRFTPTGKMARARREHQAIRLSDGSVAVTGGTGGSGVELWLPASGRWTDVLGSFRSRCQNPVLAPLPVEGFLKAERCAASRLAVSSWNVSKGLVQELAEIDAKHIRRTVLSAKGEILLLTDGGGADAFLWNPSTGRRRALSGARLHYNSCYPATDSATDELLCLATNGNATLTTLINLESGTIIEPVASPLWIGSPLVPLGDRRVFAVGTRRKVLVWDPCSPRPQPQSPK